MTLRTSFKQWTPNRCSNLAPYSLLSSSTAFRRSQTKWYSSSWSRSRTQRSNRTYGQRIAKTKRHMWTNFKIKARDGNASSSGCSSWLPRRFSRISWPMKSSSGNRSSIRCAEPWGARELTHRNWARACHSLTLGICCWSWTTARRITAHSWS